MLKNITIDECKEFLLNHYGEDQDLINVYHIASGNGVESCANRTIDDLQQCGEDLKLYQIDNGCVFGTELDGDYLNLLYIRPSFRNKDSMKDIWKTIRSTLSKKFVTSLYPKNTRAINFYLKNKGQILLELPNIVTIGFGE